MYKNEKTAIVIESLLNGVSMYPSWNWYIINKQNSETVKMKIKCAKEKEKKSLIFA